METISNLYNPPMYRWKDVWGNKAIYASPVMDKGGQYHSHDYWELFFIVSGDAIHHLNGLQTKVATRDLYLLRPGDKHCIQRVTPQGEYYLYWDIYVHEEMMQQICATLSTGTDIYTMLLFSPSPLHLHLEKGELALFIKLISSTSQQPIYYKTLLFNVISLLIRPSQNRLFSDFPSHIRALHNFISEHYLDKVAIQNYIANIGYCPQYVSRQYKKYFNKTIKDYIIECKLDYSKILLRSKDNTITDISNLLGFSCDAAFITSFKNHFGTTPHKWRTQKKE